MGRLKIWKVINLATQILQRWIWIGYMDCYGKVTWIVMGRFMDGFRKVIWGYGKVTWMTMGRLYGLPSM